MIRLILCTDAKNEADDQFAIVHALLTGKFDIKAIIADHFGERTFMDSMEKSYEECKKLLDIMQYPDEILYRGAKRPFRFWEKDAGCEGVQAIIDEAMREDERPLFICCLGPLTDVAEACVKEPEIIGRCTVIWVGGGAYPEGEEEFNLSNDIKAANIVMESGIELWQIPKNVYGMVNMGMTEAGERVRPCGRIGKYLYEQLEDFRSKNGVWNTGEAWTLGDSTIIGALLLDSPYVWEMRKAPFIAEDMTYQPGKTENRIRVYKSVDTRFIMEDFFAKLKMESRSE